MTRRNRSDVATQLRKAITDGTFKRYERLPASRALSEELGVARNTLKDALHQLEREGLVETRPGSGTYVTFAERELIPAAVEDATPLELIDARFALEPHICRLSVLHGRREDFELLDSLCSRMEAAVHDPVAFAEADTEFHLELCRSARNNLLSWLIDQINAVRSLDEWTRMLQLTLDEQTIRQYNTQHREVLNAIRAREPERAAVQMKEHLETARISLMRAAAA